MNSIEVLWEGLPSPAAPPPPLFLSSALTMEERNQDKALNRLRLFFHSVLSEDQDSYLCNVTLFRKAVDDFRHKARENK